MIGVVPTYGANLKRLRAGLTQERLAEKAGQKRQANLPSYENDRKFPSPKLIRRHAQLIGTSTADLMCGVVTEFDRVRFPDLTDAQREALLAGLVLMEAKQQVALIEAGAEALTALLAGGGSSPATVSMPGMSGKVIRTHQRRKKA